MKLVYVASPYTRGDRLDNVRAQVAAGDQLLAWGLAPVLPLLSHFWDQMSPKEYEDWLRLDLALLGRCDLLVRLPGESPGADREVEEARARGTPVYQGLEALRAALARGEVVA